MAMSDQHGAEAGHTPYGFWWRPRGAKTRMYVERIAESKGYGVVGIKSEESNDYRLQVVVSRNGKSIRVHDSYGREWRPEDG